MFLQRSEENGVDGGRRDSDFLAGEGFVAHGGFVARSCATGEFSAAGHHPPWAAEEDVFCNPFIHISEVVALIDSS